MRRLCIIACACGLLFGAKLPAASRYTSLLDQSSQRAKLETLARLEESRAWSPKTLEPLLTDRQPLIRMRCAEVLGRLGDPRGVPLLSPLVDDPDEGVAETAVFALGLIGGRESTEPIRRCLTGRSKQIRRRAIEALGRTRSPEAAKLLVPLRTHFHSAVRAEALLALVALADSTAAQQCVLSIHDPDPHVIACAVYGLGRLKHGGAEGAIVPLLSHQSPEVRMRAAEALGRLEAKSAPQYIAALLDDPDRMVAVKAAEALSRIGTDRSAEKMLPLLESPDAYLRSLALEGMAASAHGQLFASTLPLLEDGSVMVRRAAMHAIAATGGKGSREHLMRIASRGSGAEAMTALEWLGHVGAVEDLPLIVGHLLSGETLPREGAAAALGRWRDPSQLLAAVPFGDRALTPIAALLEAADGDDWVVASIAVESLGGAAPPDVIPDLIRIYHAHHTRVDGDRRLAILQAIADIGARGNEDQIRQTAIVELLKTACTDADPRIAERAARAADDFGASIAAQSTGAWDRGKQPWDEPALPLGERTIFIETERGEIEIRLFGDDAPAIVRAVLDLARKGFYNGLAFHRVVPGFVVQGGCPRGDGWGDAGYYLRSQFNLHRYERGTVGMAHSGKDTPGSQFFITHTPQPHLDGRYTVIGTVIRGMEAAAAIEAGDRFTVKCTE